MFQQPPSDTYDLPQYIAIAEALARAITAGHYPIGTRLPPERKLAKTHQVAVGTLRKSLLRLESQGLIERRHGSGNYITASSSKDALYAFFRLELRQGGGLPRAKLLSLKTLTKPKDLPIFGQSPRAHRFRRLRLLNETPVALEEIWLDTTTAPDIEPNQISTSLYQYYRTHLGLNITGAEDWVSTAPWPSWALDAHVDQFTKPKHPFAGFVERFGFSDAGEKVEYSRNWFDTETTRYVARLK